MSELTALYANTNGNFPAIWCATPAIQLRLSRCYWAAMLASSMSPFEFKLITQLVVARS
jgi:hypothetical protein